MLGRARDGRETMLVESSSSKGSDQVGYKKSVDFSSRSLACPKPKYPALLQSRRYSNDERMDQMISCFGVEGRSKRKEGEVMRGERGGWDSNVQYDMICGETT